VACTSVGGVGSGVIVGENTAVLIHPEVADALAEGRPVVALESTIISHGLPRPGNLEVARQIERAVRDGGAVPATIAIVAGTARVGLDDAALERIAGSEAVVKASVREIAAVAAAGGDGATTVASTAHLAARAGISIFATGGLGGVHRLARETWDESADLNTLSRTPITVVCAGVKSILDVSATLERLESLNIGVIGYRTDVFPGFYLRDSGHPLHWRAESPAEVANVLRSRRELGTDAFGLVVANPVPVVDELDRDLHDRTLARALAAAQEQGVSGKDVTPFLLGWFNRETQGASLATNVALVLSNARVAAEVAVEFAKPR
jgi:pseudouridine-5'-phosphate glycosidase